MTTPTEQATRVLGVLDEFIANMTKARDDLHAVLEEIAPAVDTGPLVQDPMRTPAEIAKLIDASDADRRPWVRFIPSQRWRQVESYALPDPKHGRREWAIHYLAPDGIVVELVESHTTLPAYSADELDIACDGEQKAVA